MSRILIILFVKIDNELERQKRELEVEHQRRLAGIKEDSESELRTQLRRQAAAHSDHLADVLTVQVGSLLSFFLFISKILLYTF